VGRGGERAWAEGEEERRRVEGEKGRGGGRIVVGINF